MGGEYAESLVHMLLGSFKRALGSGRRGSRAHRSAADLRSLRPAFLRVELALVRGS